MSARSFLRCLLLALVWMAMPGARADTAVSLYQSFRGTINFVGTEKTLRTAGNSAPCNLVSSTSSVYGTLAGIPTGATIISAQLYWAGSGNTPDYSVTLDGIAVTAGRKYTSATIGNGFNYFSGAADVTTQVAKKGNGSYAFGGLSVSNGSPWCASAGVLGGFSLVVVYSATSEPFRMLNLYEGFQYFQNNGFSINLGNFNVPNPLPSTVTGRVGHITWEGDADLSQGGESLLFNNVELTDSINPSGNQFNSASNVTNDSASYGIDFDIYTLKSPTISAGQSTATTTYKSGQDLVLLSAEIVAMPFVANADLSLSMTRTGDLRVGATATYSIGVTNIGVDTEVGPVTVVDTLPSGLKLVSTSGSGWTCASAAQSNGSTLVTCTSAGPVAPGAAMSSLTLTVTPSAIGNYTNSATVSGKTGDNNAANNTATNTSTSVDSGSAAVVFTTEICNAGDPIVTVPTDVGCHRFIGPVIAASNASKVYITSVSGTNKASAISSYDTTISVDLMGSCLPNSNVPLTYAGLTFACAGGVWKSVSVTVPAGKPTATLPNAWTVGYADVGRITLSLRYAGVVMGTVNFISRPADVRFQSVFRTADNVLDPKGTTAEAFAKPSPTAFARSGESFTMRLGALMANGAYAPSFGKEANELKNVLAADLIDLDVLLDVFAANPLVSPVKALRLSDGSSPDGTAQTAFSLDQDFTLNTSVTTFGALDAKARWFEAGYLAVTPFLDDYLGTGQVGGPPKPPGDKPDAATIESYASAAARLVGGTHVIGHFYPDHFQTDLTSAFDCTVDMNCPAVSTDPTKPTYPLDGAVYSTQPFALTVAAYGLPKGTDVQTLSLFRNLAVSTANANKVGTTSYRNITLSAVVKPTDTTTAALTGLSYPSGAFPTASSPADLPATGTNGAYTVGPAFDPADRLGALKKWGAPVTFYLRASMNENLVTGPTVGAAAGTAMTTKDIVVSSITPVATPAVQYEDGLMVVTGRLQVPNVFGSELLRLPVAVTTQYWNGTAWVANGNDSDSTVGQSLVPYKCTKVFVATCSANPLTMTSGSAGVSLNNGAGRIVLQSPGRGNVGSVDYTLGSTLTPWLPSTRARATFGLYKSTLIYVREVY